MEKTMFKFEDQYKQYEQLLERTKQAYEFWLNAVTSTFEDLYKLKKKWFNGGYNPPFCFSKFAKCAINYTFKWADVLFLHDFLLKFYALIPMYSAVYHKKKFP